MTSSEKANNAIQNNIKKIRSQIDASFIPKIGMVLGSGAGPVADQIEKAQHFSFADLEGFGHSSVQGHKGTLTLGYLYGVPIACLQGRPHYYEGNTDQTLRTPVRTLKALGCEMLILTNAAASTRPAVPPGELVLIKDHLNFFFKNPLTGPNDDEWGPRFPAMDDAYDADLRQQLLASAQQNQINLTEGVYLGVLGPSYETPAEIRAYTLLGADLVGMSTIPEVIVARHAGLKVAAISTVTNMACGMSDEKLNHENVLIIGKKASQNLSRLLKTFMENLNVPA